MSAEAINWSQVRLYIRNTIGHGATLAGMSSVIPGKKDRTALQRLMCTDTKSGDTGH